ncbi:hypothetical protein D3C79_611240 [compost metagenome]
MLIDRIIRQRWTPLPDLVEQILIGDQTDLASLQPLTQLTCRRQCHDRAINRNRTFYIDVLTQPLQRPGLARQQLHQFDTTACQLLLCLLPVTAVYPKPGKARTHHQRAHRTMKPR